MGQACTKAGREEASFLKSVKEGNCELVQQVVLRNVSQAYKAQTWNGQTAFHLAARHGRLEVLQTLVDSIQYNPAGPDTWKRLLRLGHSTTAIIQAFVNMQDARCQTPLHLACIYGNSECAKYLLEQGASPWVGDELGGRTPLHYAASMGHVDCIRTILTFPDIPPPRPEDIRRPNSARTRLVDVGNDSGYTPLHYAVWANNVASVRALISFDASLAARNMCSGVDWIQSCVKSTPLHLAAHRGNAEIIKVLLAAHVQSSVLPAADTPGSARSRRDRRDPRRHVNANRQLPYHVAVARGHHSLGEMLHPDVPFNFILSPAEMEAAARMYGAPKLSVIAAAVLQKKLVTEIEAAVTLRARLAMQPGGISGAGNSAGGAAGTSAGGASAAAAAATAAALAAQGSTAAGAAAAQVLAAAAAKLLQERSVHAGSMPSAFSGMDVAAAAALARSNSRPMRTSAEVPQAQRAGSIASRNSTVHGLTVFSNMAYNMTPGVSPLPSPGPDIGAQLAQAQASASASPATTQVPAQPSAATASPTAGCAANVAAAAGGGDGAAASTLSGSTQTTDSSDAATAALEATCMRQGEPANDVTLQTTVPLPLPPAPISPFLAMSAMGGGSPAVLPAAPPPAPMGDMVTAATAFALFAAEPFDDTTLPVPPSASGPGATNGAAAPAVGGSQHRRPLPASPSPGGPAAAALHTARTAEAPIPAPAANTATPKGRFSMISSNMRRSMSLVKQLPGGSKPKHHRVPSQSKERQRPQQPAGAQQQQGTAAGATEDNLLDLDALDDILAALHPNEGPSSSAQATGTPTRHASLTLRRPDGAGAGATSNDGAVRVLPSVRPTSPSGAGADDPSTAAGRGRGAPTWRFGRGLPHPPSQDPSVHSEFVGPTTAASTPRSSSGMTAPLLPSLMHAASAAVQSPTVSMAGAGAHVPAAAATRLEVQHATSLDSVLQQMLANLVDAPQAVLRSYRLLQLTHGVDLQDLLQDHADVTQAVAAALAAAAAGGDANAAAAAAAMRGLLPQQTQQQSVLPEPSSRRTVSVDGSTRPSPAQPVATGDAFMDSAAAASAVVAMSAQPSTPPPVQTVGGSVHGGNLGITSCNGSNQPTPRAVPPRSALYYRTTWHGQNIPGLSPFLAAATASNSASRAALDQQIEGDALAAASEGTAVLLGTAASRGEPSFGQQLAAREAEMPTAAPDTAPADSVTSHPALVVKEATARASTYSSPFAAAASTPLVDGYGSPITSAPASALAQPASPSTALLAAMTPREAAAASRAASLAQRPGGPGASVAGAPMTAGQILRTLSAQMTASEAGDNMCGVCFDQPDFLVITGCNHRLCADCSRELCKLHAFKPSLCPFCRGFIGGFTLLGQGKER